MARIGTTVNLEANSRYDILIYDFPEGYPTGTVALGFGENPKRISGISKVSQIFLKTLMTLRGSDVVNPNYGTIFPTFTGSYNLQSTDLSDVSSDVTGAIRDAEEQAKSILNIPTEGLTSQLESVTIVDITQIEDMLTLRVALRTRAGETAPIALPFTSLGLEVDSQ